MRNYFLLLLIGLTACGEADGTPTSGSSGQGLQVSPDAFVTTATYTISGPDDFASAGTVPVGDTPDVPVTLSHLPVGQGYEIELNAIASDGVIVCEGSTTFDVLDSNATFTVIVHLECAVPSGDLNFQVTVNICPLLDGLGASPLVLNLGGVSSLVAEAHDSDNGPAPLAYSWSVNGFKLPNKIAPTLALACTSAGNLTIASTVSDGDPDPACAATSSLTVSCE